MRVELTRRCASHGRPVAALLVALAICLVAAGIYWSDFAVAAWCVSAVILLVATTLALLCVRAQADWENYVFVLAQHREPEAFPALLDALYRAEQLTIMRPETAHHYNDLVASVLQTLKWRLDRPERLAGVILSPQQQERLHMAMMSEHSDLVRSILHGLPYLADDESAIYVGKLAAGCWSAEYDEELRRDAARLLPLLAA